MLIEKAFLCRFLSLSFSYPTEGSLNQLMGALPDLERSLSALSINFPVDELRGAIETGMKHLTDLQGEFTSLFETSVRAPARETSYELEKAGRRSVEMADILGFYRAFGVELKAPVEPDSLVAELEFLSLLYQKEEFLSREGDTEGTKVVREARDKFLREHVGRWYDIFSEKVKEEAEGSFYPKMADLLKTFLDRETEKFGDIQKLTSYRKESLEGSSWECGFMGHSPPS